MPDQGRAAFIYDIFADSLGYQNAARYITPPGEEVKFSPEVGVAQLESNQLLAGQQVQVIPGQNDAAMLGSTLPSRVDYRTGSEGNGT